MALPLPLIALAAKVLIPAAVSGIGRLFSRPSAPDYPTVQVGGITWVAVPHGREREFEAANQDTAVRAADVTLRIARKNPEHAEAAIALYETHQASWPGHTLYIR